MLATRKKSIERNMTINIPKELGTQLKTTCSTKGISIKEGAAKAISDWLNRP
jgi:hypothetical protein